ncbi:MAG: hypothetical protein RLZZ28_2410 [Bacteroidota bacterium]
MRPKHLLYLVFLMGSIAIIYASVNSKSAKKECCVKCKAPVPPQSSGGGMEEMGSSINHLIVSTIR